MFEEFLFFRNCGAHNITYNDDYLISRMNQMAWYVMIFEIRSQDLLSIDYKIDIMAQGNTKILRYII